MRRKKTTYRISDGKGNAVVVSTAQGESYALKQFMYLCPWGNPAKLSISRRCSHDNCRNFTAHANGICSRHQPTGN